MAKLTLQQKFALALQNRGYVLQPNTRGGKFEIMVMGDDCSRPLFKPVESLTEPHHGVKEHRVLLGSGGALRWTTTTIAMSRVFSDKMREKLLSEVESI